MRRFLSEIRRHPEPLRPPLRPGLIGGSLTLAGLAAAAGWALPTLLAGAVAVASASVAIRRLRR